MAGVVLIRSDRSTCKSLPPLPDHGLPAKLRKLWGEDEILNKKLDIRKSGLSKIRTSFDNCIPDADVGNTLPRNYSSLLTEADVKFPKATHLGRRVSRDPTFQVFPLNDPNRTRDGQMVLSEETRTALDLLWTRLHRTSENSRIYTDKSTDMKKRMERETQFTQEAQLYPKVTCSRIVHHGDPCPVCWVGHSGLNYGLSPPQYNEFSTTYGSSFNWSDKLKDKTDTWEHVSDNIKHGMEQTVLTSKENIAGFLCNDSGVFENLDTFLPSDNYAEKDGIMQDKMLKTKAGKDDFGPWIDTDQIEFYCHPDDEDVVTDVNDSKFESCNQCYCYPHTGNVTVIEPGYLRNFEPEEHLNPDYQQTYKMEAKGDADVTPKVLSLTNSWTNRDENNLRRPCVSKVLGMLSKHEAQKRYHLTHPDPIPDLRTNRRPARRVQFFGYPSSVFRG